MAVGTTGTLDPVLTVIVPVYKVEPWLDRCVASLVGQTLRAIAIILVDDGSPDRCGALCDAWAAKDPRITVIHQANGGLSAARNAGLDKVETPYVMFCDSDDSFDLRMCQIMYETLEEKRCGFVRCRFDDGDPNHPDGMWKRPRYGRRKSSLGLVNEMMETSVCNKIFRMSVIREHALRFPVGLMYEDTEFFLEYAAVVDDFVSLRTALYHYYQHPESICHANEERLSDGAADHLTMCGRLHDFLKREGLWERERKNFWVRCADVFAFIHDNAGPRRAEMFQRANAFLDRFGADEFAWAPWWLHRRLEMIRRNGEGGEPVVRRALLKIGRWKILEETDAPGKRKICLFGRKLYGRSRCARYDG